MGPAPAESSQDNEASTDHYFDFPHLLSGGGGPSASRPANAAMLQFRVRRQAGDGNCLFRSFSDQIYGTPDYHALVRGRCVEYIASEKNYFEQFVTQPFNQFLEKIQRDGEWGDDVEIEALSEIYDCRVEIYDSYTQSLMRTFHEACKAQRPLPVRLQYEGRAHYNSLAPFSGLVPLAKSTGLRPGELEDAAIVQSRKRQGRGRSGAAEVDAEQTDLEMIDNVLKESRQQFQHQSQEEMDRALEESRVLHMDKEVVDRELQDSRDEFDLSEQMRVENEMVAQVLQQSARESNVSEEARIENEMMASVMQQSAAEAPRQMQQQQYPPSVVEVMSMGFPPEKCLQAYELVGDDAESIYQCLVQNL